MRYLSWVLWLAIVLIATMFASLNSHDVVIQYYFGQSQVLLPFLLLVALGIGAILGCLMLAPVWLKLLGRNRSLQQKVKTMELEVNNLRNIPIKDAH